MQLEPVSFNYKGSTEEQYGVIAEKAVEPYHEMVVLDAQGLPYAFQYQKLDGILIHEIQRDHLANQALDARTTALETEAAALDTRVTTIEGQQCDTRIAALESKNLDTRLTTIEGQNLDARVKALENATLKTAGLEQQLTQSLPSRVRLRRSFL